MGSAPPASAAEQALRDAGAALERDADRIAEHVADVLASEVPEVSPDPLSREETRRTCRATLLALMAAWRHGESLDHVEPPRELLFQIEVLARDGIPLRPFTRMCHLAHGAFIDAWDAELSAAPLPRDVQLAAIRTAHQLTFQWFDSLVERLTTVYQSEVERLARTPETIRRAVVQSALSGKSVDVDALSRAAGYEFRRQHVGLVLWHATPDADGVPAAADAQPTFLAIARGAAVALGASAPLVVSAGSSVAWAWLGMRELPAASRVRSVIDAELRGNVAITIGDPAAGIEGFRYTHEDALAASRVAMLRPPPAPPVTEFPAVELVAMLSGDLRRSRRFVTRHLGPLATRSPDSDVLRTALLTHLEERGHRPAAAQRLGVHPNTISNRVRAAEAHLPPESDPRSVELHVALLLAQTLGKTVLA